MAAFLFTLWSRFFAYALLLFKPTASLTDIPFISSSFLRFLHRIRSVETMKCGKAAAAAELEVAELEAAEALAVVVSQVPNSPNLISLRNSRIILVLCELFKF